MVSEVIASCSVARSDTLWMSAKGQYSLPLITTLPWYDNVGLLAIPCNV